MMRKLHSELHFANYKNNLTTFIFSIIISIISIVNAEAQNKAAAIDNLMKHCSANGIFNGTILVSEDGKVIYKKAFGYLNNETKQKLTTKSVFGLASVSKQFTAMGIMILQERNKLSYSDKLIKYFPELPDYAKDITVRNLLNHTSGLPQYYEYTDKDNLHNSEILKILINRNQLDFKTGEQYVYNNGGYVLLALIIEKISNQPFEAFLKENIFDPLEMKNTLVCSDSLFRIRNRAIGYTRIGETDDFRISHTGSTSMISNVDDLFLWEQSLYGQKLVSNKTMDEAFMSVFLNNGSISNYGFGWKIKNHKQDKTVEHSGSDFGYRTFIKRNLTKNNSYILLTNNGDAVALNEINGAIDNILEVNAYELPKIPVFSKLKESLKNNSTDTAIEITRQAIKKTPDLFAFDDDAINELGYKYLVEKKTNDALSIFKFNAELNPNSSNVYDSLGEVYLVVNDTVNAAENYKKSIKLDSNNANAITVLTKLGISSAELVAKVIVPSEVLRSYGGKYQLNNNYFFTVTSDDKQLFIQGTGEAITTVFPMSQNRFYSKIISAQFTFNTDQNGKIASLTINMGSDIIAKKIE
ncbi:serine hydrolase [Flavobacterium collinsii]|uniref:CubicO group peptidase (Beta-lactamase class C family) n=1 Tax=Flavobacterium collinsii TaxID=1114861 RepID=A0A9W4TJJ6_9FLAO|nr:serine hydrolase [Flavobacterium collinsii]CAI2768169.1 CubicO group peptidase (Beta-lactamase class C family) [Flavobacterium collinsii]